MLQAFQEYGSNGSSTRPPLQFTYTPNHGVNITKTGTSNMILAGNSTASSPNIITNADFDGDGTDDLMVYKGNKTIRIYFSKSGSNNGVFQYFGEYTQNDATSPWKDVDSNGTVNDMKSVVRFGDFDGNGMTDIMYRSCENHNVKPPLSTDSWRICTSLGDDSFRGLASGGNQPYLAPEDVNTGNWSSDTNTIVCMGNFMGDGKTYFLVDHRNPATNTDKFDLF